MRKVLVVLMVMAIILGVPELGAAKSPSQRPGLVIATSDQDFTDWHWSGDTEGARFEIVTGEAQARRIVRAVPAYARAAVKNALAEVDFDKEVAVFVSLGETSGGYNVEIGQVNINERSLLVRVGMESPKAGEAVNMMAQHPFDVVALARQDMPQGDFEFVVFNQHGTAVKDEWLGLTSTPKTNVWSQWYVVRTGDSLWSLANKYKITVESIMEWNDLQNHDIFIGQILRFQA